MRKKLVFGGALIGISMLNPSCKHPQVNVKTIYMDYLIRNTITDTKKVGLYLN